MKTALCTLFEGNYHFGVAALSNSLVAGGYEGVLWAGFRGQLPGWVTRSNDFDAALRRLTVTTRFAIRFVELDTHLHFAYCKPAFARDVLRLHDCDADTVAYIDPDIVVKCEWKSLAVMSQ